MAKFTPNSNLTFKDDKSKKFVEFIAEAEIEFEEQDLKKEWAEKRKEKEKLMKTLPNYESPGIKSIRRGRPKISSLGLFITRDEKNVLYKKLVGLGFDSKTANERIDNLCEKMRKVVEKLRETVKSEEDLNKRFREEFGKMCMELESGGLE